MTTQSAACSPFTRSCLNMQGFTALSDEAKAQYTWALRFTPGVCSALVIVGLALQSWPLLLGVMAIALIGAIFPAAHPFDLVYNYGVRHLFKARALPPNPAPRRFACFMASAFLAASAGAFLAGAEPLAFGLGGFLAGAVIVVATTHWCLPSFTYGILRRVFPLPAS